METIISIQSATMGYQKVSQQIPVLSGINCEFKAGELVGVAGMNGVGKSTLLRSLAGLIPLLSGKIIIDGKDLRTLSANETARTVAVVLTKKISGFNLTVFDAVSAGQMPYTNAFHQLGSRH